MVRHINNHIHIHIMRKLLYLLPVFLVLLVKVYAQTVTLVSTEAYYGTGTTCLNTQDNITFPDTPNSYGSNSWWTSDFFGPCDNCDYYARLYLNFSSIQPSQVQIEIKSDDGQFLWVNGKYVGQCGGSCHAGGTCQRTWDITQYLNLQGNNEIWIWCSEAGGDDICQFRLYVTYAGNTYTIDVNKQLALYVTTASFEYTSEYLGNVSSIYQSTYSTSYEYLGNISAVQQSTILSSLEYIGNISAIYSSTYSTSYEYLGNISAIITAQLVQTVFPSVNFTPYQYTSDVYGNLKITRFNFTLQSDFNTSIVSLFLFDPNTRTVTGYDYPPMVYVNGNYIGNTTVFSISNGYNMLEIRDNNTAYKTVISITLFDPNNPYYIVGIVAFGKYVYMFGSPRTVSATTYTTFKYAIPLVIYPLQKVTHSAVVPIILDTSTLKNLLNVSLSNNIFVMYYNPALNTLQVVPSYIDTSNLNFDRLVLYVKLPSLDPRQPVLLYLFVTQESNVEFSKPNEVFYYFVDLTRPAYYSMLNIFSSQEVTFNPTPFGLAVSLNGGRFAIYIS